MSWMQMAQARFSQKAPQHTDETAESSVMAVSSVRSACISQIREEVSSVSAVGGKGMVENGPSAEELLDVAMRACAYWRDTTQARDQMRTEVLEVKPEHRTELLNMFREDYR